MISVNGTVAHKVAFRALNRVVAPQRALGALITLHWDHEKWEGLIKKILHTLKSHPSLPRSKHKPLSGTWGWAFDQGLGHAPRGHP